MLDETIHNHLVDLSDKEKWLLTHRDQAQLEFIKKKACFTIESSEVIHDGESISITKNYRFIHVPKHRHGYVEMIYVYQGNFRQVINAKEINLTKGDIFILNQNVVHEILECSQQDVVINFAIDPDFFEDLFPILGYENIISKFIVLSMYKRCMTDEYLGFSTENNAKIHYLMETIIEEFYENSSLTEKKIKMMMGLLLIELLQNRNQLTYQTKITSDDAILISVLNLIDKEYRDIKMEQVAEHIRIPSYKLRKLLKQKTGMTFTSLVQEKKLEKAASMLIYTNKPIEDIVIEIGYDNISYFYRIFEKKFGLSLRKYRDRFFHRAHLTV